MYIIYFIRIRDSGDAYIYDTGWYRPVKTQYYPKCYIILSRIGCVQSYITGCIVMIDSDSVLYLHYYASFCKEIE